MKVAQTGAGPSSALVDKAIYIKDNDSGQFWSLGHFPAEQPYDTFQATHAPGYSTITSSAEKIDSSATFFVPEKDACEIWQLQLSNNERKKRRLSLFVYGELPEITDCEVVVKNNTVLIATRGQADGDQLYFYAFDKSLDSFDTDKEVFIGPYRTTQKPRSVEDGKCSRTLASRSPIVALQRNVTLGANTNTEIIVVAGVIEIDATAGYPTAKAGAIRRAETIIERYRRAHVAEEALTSVRKKWGELVENFVANTPDDALNASFNYWAKYQNVTAGKLAHRHSVTANAAKQLIASLPLLNNPREIIDELLERELKDGRVVERIDQATKQTKISDDTSGAAWLILAVCAYVNETGDLDFLHEQVAWHDHGQGSVLEHVNRLVRHCLSGLKDQHIQSTKQIGETVWALRELMPILSAARESEAVRNIQSQLEEITQSFNRRMWDGSWYLARRNDKKVGTKKNIHHKIDLEAQVWAVLAGLASTDRSTKALNMAWRQLGSPVGLTNINPVYSKYDPDNPESLNGAGSTTNGAVNISLNALAIAAEAKLGRGELAYKLFQQTSHIYRSDNQETFKGEPFVYPAFIFGPESSQYARADLVWQKNPGGWIWKVLLEQVFGAQPVVGGLKIDPCLPHDWRQIEFTRQFRNAQYHFRIFNPTRQSKGVERVIVDGIRQTGNLIKPFQGGLHYIEVYLG